MARAKDKLLKPHIKPLPPRHPRCSAKLATEAANYWSRNLSKTGHYPMDPHDQCHSQSSYRIDGKYFCRKHAGLYLLDKQFPASEFVA